MEFPGFLATLTEFEHGDGRIEYRTDPQWFTPYMRREGVEWTPESSAKSA